MSDAVDLRRAWTGRLFAFPRRAGWSVASCGREGGARDERRVGRRRAERFPKRRESAWTPLKMHSPGQRGRCSMHPREVAARPAKDIRGIDYGEQHDGGVASESVVANVFLFCIVLWCGQPHSSSCTGTEKAAPPRARGQMDIRLTSSPTTSWAARLTSVSLSQVSSCIGTMRRLAEVRGLPCHSAAVR